METCAPPFYCLTAAAHGLLVYVGVIAFAGVWQVLQSAPRRRMISAPTWGAVRIRRGWCKSGIILPGPRGRRPLQWSVAVTTVCVRLVD